MSFESLIRIMVMAAIMNLASTSYLLFGRPDLAVRDSAEKLYVLAVTLENEGKFTEASKHYERIFYDMSVTLIAPKAGQRLADIYRRRLFDVDKARDVLREAAAFQGSAYAADAAKDLAFIDSNWDADGSALKAWYEASNTYRKNDKNGALNLLNKLITEKPKASIRPTAMIRAAKIAKELGRNDQAAETIRSYLSSYPQDTGVAEARSILQQVR